MQFKKTKVVSHDPVLGSFDPNGNPTTTAVVTQAEVTDLLFGDGTTSFTITDNSGQKVVQSIALPAAYNDASTFFGNVAGHTQIFLSVKVVALGAGGLTGITCLIEFKDPDYPDFWFPSKEGVARDTAALATYEWACNGVQNYTIATRVEHPHFKMFRARFKKSAGNTDSATQILVSWQNNGLPSPVSP